MSLIRAAFGVFSLLCLIMLAKFCMIFADDPNKPTASAPAPPVQQPDPPPDMAQDNRSVEEVMESALMGAGDTPEEDFKEAGWAQNVGSEMAFSGKVLNDDPLRVSFDGYDKGALWVEAPAGKLGSHIGIVGTIVAPFKIKSRAVMPVAEFMRLRRRVKARLAKEKAAADKEMGSLPIMPAGSHTE